VRTFEKFLEDQGFDPEATESTTHPDFYRLARNLHEALEKIAALDRIPDYIGCETHKIVIHALTNQR